MTLESWLALLEARVSQLGLIGTGERTQPLLSGGIAFIETGAGVGPVPRGVNADSLLVQGL